MLLQLNKLFKSNVAKFPQPTEKLLKTASFASFFQTIRKMSANDWKLEMACMLGNIESQVTLTLTNISQSDRSLDGEFKEYFFRTLIDR